jgi:FkbM family methyltransferase
MIRARSQDGKITMMNKWLNSSRLNEELAINKKDTSQLRFWKDVYKRHVSYLIKYWAFLKYIPGSLASRLLFPHHFSLLSLYDQGVGAGSQESNIRLRKIFIPYPQDTKDRNVVFSKVILDTFTQYLLDLDVNEEAHILGILPEGPYERKEVHLNADDIVIDAGANMGDFSALAAYKGAVAYAFEPSKTIIDRYLAKTISLNEGLPGEIILAPYALANEIGKTEFATNSFNMGASRMGGGRKGDLIEEVDVITLDAYVNENNLERVDFIKADIEGAERLMLKGARGVLKDFAPKLAICTYHLPDDPQVLEALVLEANPRYVVEHKYKKMYAYVPE